MKDRRPLGRDAALRVDDVDVATVEVAATFWRRFRGLMLRRRLPAGLWLTPERAVHGLWMLHPLDVASVDADGNVLDVTVLHPWRALREVPGTRSVLEAPAGSFARWGLVTGSRLTLDAQ